MHLSLLRNMTFNFDPVDEGDGAQDLGPASAKVKIPRHFCTQNQRKKDFTHCPFEVQANQCS